MATLQRGEIADDKIMGSPGLQRDEPPRAPQAPPNGFHLPVKIAVAQRLPRQEESGRVIAGRYMGKDVQESPPGTAPLEQAAARQPGSMAATASWPRVQWFM